MRVLTWAEPTRRWVLERMWTCWFRHFGVLLNIATADAAGPKEARSDYQRAKYLKHCQLVELYGEQAAGYMMKAWPE